VSGTIQFEGKTQTVTGHAWYDREWSASLLDKDKLGWDWFSVVDNSQSNKQGLMLFCIRKKQQQYDYCSATKIAADGTVSTYQPEQISLSVLETTLIDNTVYPKKWQATLPDMSSVIIETVTTDSRNQLTIPYWEGRVKVSGGLNGKGYAELVGY
jgi:predicted secreted hydrolase